MPNSSQPLLKTWVISSVSLALGIAVGAACATVVVSNGRNRPLSDSTTFWSSVSGIIPFGPRKIPETEAENETRKGDSPPSADDVPSNAPEHCPGVESDKAGNADACEGCPNQSICSSGAATKPDTKVSAIADKLKSVKHKIVVLSGKGGVGKSTVATQVSWALQAEGYSVGLLDVDICGPSVPRMTGTVGASVRSAGEGWCPVYVRDNFEVMSIGYLLPSDDDPIIWRGPKKTGLIAQFLTDVCWGDLDFLVVDTPPGTTDEHLSLVTYLRDAKVDGAILVTTPQEVSLQDVRKEINFCKKVGLKVLGVVENMSGGIFEESNLGGTEAMCVKMDVPYAGRLMMSRALLRAGEDGVSVFDSDDKRVQSELKGLINSCLKVGAIPYSLKEKTVADEKTADDADSQGGVTTGPEVVANIESANIESARLALSEAVEINNASVAVAQQ